MRFSKHAAAAPFVAVLQQTKTASLPAPGPTTGQRLLSLGKSAIEVGSVAVPIAALMAQGVSIAAQKMTEASRKANAYKQMVAENPHIGEHDPSLSQRYFNTLYRLNPTLATDPTVAASFVNNMVRVNNPTHPHAALFEQASKLYDPKAGPQTSFGKDLSAEMLRMGTMLRQDKTKDLQESIVGLKDLMGEQRNRFQGEIAGLKTDLQAQAQGHRKELRDRERMDRIKEIVRRRGPPVRNP